MKVSGCLSAVARHNRIEAPFFLSACFLAAFLGASAACGKGSSTHDLENLDAKLLAAVTERFAPLALFSGVRVSRLEVTPLSLDACPTVPERATKPNAEERRRQIGLSRSLHRLARSGKAGAPVLRLQALWMFLAEPTPAGRNRAVELFQTALTYQPESAAYMNDLAAALLIRAGLDRRPEDLALALNLLDPLVAHRQPTPAALFNYAHALQCLTLWNAAQATLRRMPKSTRSVSEQARAEVAPLVRLDEPGSLDDPSPRRVASW